MIISAYDQLICVDEADSYASSMGMDFPSNGANAQYYKKAGNAVTEVSPHFYFNTQSDRNELLFFPQVFASIGNSYLTPGTNDVFTFRLNNLSGSNAIIAQGTVDNFALVDSSRVWSTAEQGKAQTYADVFRATTYQFNGITIPALGIRGDLAYGTQSDLSFYCTVDFDGGSISCKGDFEIRSMENDMYKLAISAESSLGGNDRVINTNQETITLTARLLKNGQNTGASGATFNWHRLDDDTSLGTGASLVVSEGMVSGHAIFVCDATYEGNTYSASIDVDDIQDQYAIQKGRTVYSQYDSNNSSNNVVAENSNVIKKTYTVVYIPSVVDTTTGAAYSGTGTWTYDAIVKDNNKNERTRKTGITASDPLIITGANVKTWGGANVHFTATNSNI